MPGEIKVNVDGNTPRIYYNGFTFPPAVRTRVSATPVNNPSNRAIKWLQITVTVEAVINGTDFDEDRTGTYAADNADQLLDGNTELAAGSNIDPAMLPLFRRLLSPGKNLELIGLGIGNFAIDNNTNRLVRRYEGETYEVLPDLSNGPHPAFLEIASITNSLSAHVIWAITFTVNPCEDNDVNRSVPTLAGFDFEIDYQISDLGLFTRNISGVVEAPNYVRNNRTAINLDAIDVPNSVKDRIANAFPTIPVCTRSQSYVLSNDRTQIRFSISDVQIDSDEPYFPGCGRLKFSHNIRSRSALAAQVANTAVIYDCFVTGSVEVLKGYPKSTAWTAFTAVLKKILTPYSLGADNKVGSNDDKGCFLQSFNVTNEIHGRTVSFFISYWIPSTLVDLLGNTKLFPNPANPQEWITWDAARKNQTRPFGFDGNTVLAPNQSTDSVINICTTANPSTLARLPEAVPNSQSLSVKDSPFVSGSSTKRSYVAYKNQVSLSSDMNVSVQSYLGSSDADGRTGLLSFQESGGTANGIEVNRGTGETINSFGVRPNIVQEHGTGQHYLRLKGWGKRVGFPVEVPFVKDIGVGRPPPTTREQAEAGETAQEPLYPVLLTDRVMPSQLDSYTADGKPIYVAAWDRVYCLPMLGNRQIALGNVDVRYLTTEKDYPVSGKSGGGAIDPIVRPT